MQVRRQFVERCVASIPGRDQEAVNQHDQWFARFLAYKDRKKELIAQWRAAKEVRSLYLAVPPLTSLSAAFFCFCHFVELMLVVVLEL